MNRVANRVLFLEFLAFALWIFSVAVPVFSDVLSLKGKELFAPGEVLVRFNDGVSEADKTKVLATGTSHASLGFNASSLSNVYKLKLVDGADVLKTVESLKNSSAVSFAQPNYKYYALACSSIPSASNDQYFAAPYNWPFLKIQAAQAWALPAWTSCPGSGVTVAVLDTGVDRSNPDLSSTNVPKIGYNEICAFGEQATTCTCSTTYSDSASNGAATNDDYGHGTWVSGIIAAEWNAGATVTESQCGGATSVTGMAGLAGGAVIMPIKVLDCAGNGYSDEIAAGIIYAAQNGAKVISMSLGGSADTVQQNAVNEAIGLGCVVVAASGNEYADTLDYPAGYPGVLSVGATDQNDNVASYSNGGSGLNGKTLDLVAPGGATAPSSNFNQSVSFSIFSTFLCGVTGGSTGTDGFLSDPADGNFGLAAGTSGATPFVSAAAALVFSLHPTWTNTQVIQQLVNNTDSLNGNGSWDIRSGYGRLNIYKALSSSLGSGQVATYVKTFNSPNPFYADLETYTHITLVMSQAESVQLSIYDTAGELVLSKTYSSGQLDNDPSTPQFKSFYVAWDGKNGAGQPVKTGVYFYTVNVGGQVSHNKIVVIRGPK